MTSAVPAACVLNVKGLAGWMMETKPMDRELRRMRLAYVFEAEKAGRVSDSMFVRLELIAKMNAGKMTLDQVKKNLARIKRDGRKLGQITRAEAYRGK